MRRMIAAVLILTAAGCASYGGRAGPRSATFAARNAYTIKIPAGTRSLRAWFALPQETGTEPAQEIRDLRIECTAPHRIETDSEGNRVLYIEADHPAPGPLAVVETFTVTRREIRNDLGIARTRPYTEAERAQYAPYLQANANVEINDEIRALASQIVGGEQDPVRAARKIYDWVLGNVDYWVKYPSALKASPVGSATYCLSTHTGNCTDFHSLWTALARASGIPTRMVYGSFFKADLDGKDSDQSYHCWPEFYVPEVGWVPHDVAVADLFVGDFPLTVENEGRVRLTTASGYIGADPARVDYYFGSIDERRVTWSRGRDLVMTPPTATGPVNALPKAHIEIDGVVAAEGADKAWTRKLTFREALR